MPRHRLQSQSWAEFTQLVAEAHSEGRPVTLSADRDGSWYSATAEEPAQAEEGTR
jgi:hypothetical protein